MKSAWKLTQDLDWEQSLFCAKICELVRYAIYYAGKPRAARLCGRHQNSLLAAPPRASSTRSYHKYITIAHRFSSKGNGWTCLVPRRLSLSLLMKMCAQPSVPFPWSLAVHHQSLAFRARLYDEKNEAPEEEAVDEQFDLHTTKCLCISANRIHHFYLRELTQTWTHLHHHNPLLLEGLWEEELLKHRSPRLL